MISDNYHHAGLFAFLLCSAFGCQSEPDEKTPSPEPSIAISAAPGAPSVAMPAVTQAAVEPAPPSASAPSTPGATPATAPAPRAAKTGPSTAAPAKTYAGDDPCTHKPLRIAQVRFACQTGGRPAAKTLMKNMVAKAKKAGENIKCTSCHVDTKKFDLKDNALSDLKKLL